MQNPVPIQFNDLCYCLSCVYLFIYYFIYLFKKLWGVDRRRKHKGNELTPVFCRRVTPRDEPSELGLGVAHFQFAQSLSGKWKVVRCAHALPGINIKAQKWRYTAPSCTPVSPIHRRFNITALRLYRSKFWETCAGRRPHFHGLSCEPQGG